MNNTHHKYTCTCPLCKSEAKLMMNDLQGYKEGMLFDIYFCDNCVTSFPTPTVDAKEIYDFIYTNKEIVPGYSRYARFFSTIKNQRNPLKFLARSENTYWGVQEALKQIVPNKKESKILEIGSGLGYLTYALRKEKYDIVGLDISKEAVNNANTSFGNYFIAEDLFVYNKTHKEEFDIVILTEVIEHVENPIEFLKAIEALLKKNGKVIMTTPNKSIAPLDVVWSSELPPIHHWWFSEESIKYMAGELKFDYSFVDFSGFHKIKPKTFNVKKARRNEFDRAILNKDWKLNKESKSTNSFKSSSLYRAIMIPFSYVKRAYLSIKKSFNKDMIVMSKRSNTLCVILKKKVNGFTQFE